MINVNLIEDFQELVGLHVRQIAAQKLEYAQQQLSSAGFENASVSLTHEVSLVHYNVPKEMFFLYENGHAATHRWERLLKYDQPGIPVFFLPYSEEEALKVLAWDHMQKFGITKKDFEFNDLRKTDQQIISELCETIKRAESKVN